MLRLSLTHTYQYCTTSYLSSKVSISCLVTLIDCQFKKKNPKNKREKIKVVVVVCFVMRNSFFLRTFEREKKTNNKKKQQQN